MGYPGPFGGISGSFAGYPDLLGEYSDLLWDIRIFKGISGSFGGYMDPLRGIQILHQYKRGVGSISQARSLCGFWVPSFLVLRCKYVYELPDMLAASIFFLFAQDQRISFTSENIFEGCGVEQKGGGS